MAHESHDYKATAAKLRELAHQVQSDYCRDRLLRMAQGFRQAAKHAEWRLAAPREAISPGLKVGAAGCRVDRGEGARRSFLYGLAHRAADRFRALTALYAAGWDRATRRGLRQPGLKTAASCMPAVSRYFGFVCRRLGTGAAIGVSLSLRLC